MADDPRLQPTTVGAGPFARTLSKSDFKAARACEAKLYFRENGYPSSRDDNPFMEMLAEGGYMVEALAKARYPDGQLMGYGSDPVVSWEATRRALESELVTLFEATLLHERRLARVDILEKRGSTLRLIEVKAKSIDLQDHRALLELGKLGSFRSSRKPHGIVSEWQEYLEDLTYQVLLLEALMPGCVVEPWLALVDTSATCALERTFDRFERVPQGESPYAPRFLGSPEELELLPLIAEVPVGAEVEMLRDDVSVAASRYAMLLDAPRSAFNPRMDHACRDCEYRHVSGGPSGFDECWGPLATEQPHVLDLFSIGKVKAADGRPIVNALFQEGKASLFDIPEDRLSKKDGSIGPEAARQLRQIRHTREGTVFLSPGFRERLESIRYPIHFIDFEACRVALPYHAGMRPYGLLAFQWSCHTVSGPGAAPSHREWLNMEEPWPSAAFIESLRECVGDTGSLLTWSPFERSSLNDIRRQMETRRLVPPDLAAWFDTLPGRIVDLARIAADDFFHPLMGGKTSIKVVLDALWQADPVLRTQCGEWLSFPLEAGADPYKALPPLVIGGVAQSVHEGTGAIRAYEAMMFSSASNDPEVRRGWSALLRRYCELDTLSMVLIFEHWRRIGRHGDPCA